MIRQALITEPKHDAVQAAWGNQLKLLATRHLHREVDATLNE